MNDFISLMMFSIKICTCKDFFIINFFFYSFLQGVGPTAQRAAVIAAVELPIYDYTKSKCMNVLGDSVSNHFL